MLRPEIQGIPVSPDDTECLALTGERDWTAKFVSEEFNDYLYFI
jgi:hypothetical protein